MFILITKEKDENIGVEITEVDFTKESYGFTNSLMVTPTQKELFRFAATLYTETSDVYSTTEAQVQMIKCVFIEYKNALLSTNDIVNGLLDLYKYHITPEEIDKLVNLSKKTFDVFNNNGERKFCLKEEAYVKTVSLQDKNIDAFIEQFVNENGIDDATDCKSAIHRYLYELTTTNLLSYQIMIDDKKGFDLSEKDLSVNENNFTVEEKKYIHDFLQWENDEKNIALSNLVLSCLEYCLLVNGDKPNTMLLNSIRKRQVYLDTNIIFLALGINGKSPQRMITSFLKKCKQAKVEVKILHNTKKEFFDTIDYYIAQIVEYPRGKIYQGAYEQITDYKLFSFYEDWHKENPSKSIKYFTLHIKTIYAKLIEEFNIVDDDFIPDDEYKSEEFKRIRGEYSVSINNKKNEAKSYDRYTAKDSHDATIVRHIEVLREKVAHSVDIFLISLDKLLRYWDSTRQNRSFPVVIYPSQLFLILIKLCGRSEDDFSGFINFINIQPCSYQLSAEKANIILSGISSITEDIESQKILVSAICEGEFQDIIQSTNKGEELYQQVQEFSQKYLEGELVEKTKTIENSYVLLQEKNLEIERLQEETKQTHSKYTDTQIALKDVESKWSDEKKKTESLLLKICEKKVKPKFFIKWYFVPGAVIISWLLVLVFIGLQFWLCDEPWNIVTDFFSWVKTTTFGQMVGDFVYCIDVAIFGIPVFLTKKFFRNPFNKHKRTNDYNDMIKDCKSKLEN